MTTVTVLVPMKIRQWGGRKAIIAPDGKVRHNGLHPGMPHAEKLAMIDALLAEFGKRPAATVPPAKKS